MRPTYVAEVTIVDDGTVENVGVLLDDFVSLVGDHTRRSTILGVD